MSSSSGKFNYNPIIAGVLLFIAVFLVIACLVRRHCKNKKRQELTVTADNVCPPSYEEAMAMTQVPSTCEIPKQVQYPVATVYPVAIVV